MEAMSRLLTRTPLHSLRTGSVVRAARREAGLTQRELGERVGTTQSAVARWESGAETPRFDTLASLMRACGVEVDVSFRRHDDVDRSQIREHLALTPAERLEAQRRMAAFRSSARKVR
jgi:transcriptional regulator with XRE-family HTH domain